VHAHDMKHELKATRTWLSTLTQN